MKSKQKRGCGEPYLINKTTKSVCGYRKKYCDKCTKKFVNQAGEEE